MVLPDLCVGLVIRYAFLWRSEERLGREEGAKDRPCIVVRVALTERGDRSVIVLPVTHAKPTDMRAALEIPAATKARLGLDDKPSWIITDEVNRFTWPGPDLRPVSREASGDFAFGILPHKLVRQIQEQIKDHAREQRIKVVERG